MPGPSATSETEPCQEILTGEGGSRRSRRTPPSGRDKPDQPTLPDESGQNDAKHNQCGSRRFGWRSDRQQFGRLANGQPLNKLRLGRIGGEGSGQRCGQHRLRWVRRRRHGAHPSAVADDRQRRYRGRHGDSQSPPWRSACPDTADTRRQSNAPHTPRGYTRARRVPMASARDFW